MSTLDHPSPKPARGARSPLVRWLMSLMLGLLATASLAAAPRDRLTLLVPDGADLTSWQVKVWTDSAAEEGIRLELITDSALVALGSSAATKIAGLIVPDSAHIKASDAVIAAIQQFAYNGGDLMLVYDAGVQTPTGFFPTATNSRFASLVGVDYVFWNNGAGAATMVGFGQVVGTRGVLDSLSIAPGKYLPYVAPTSLITSSPTTAFVQTTQADPAGSVAMADAMRARIADPSLGQRRWLPLSVAEVQGSNPNVPAPLRLGSRMTHASITIDKLAALLAPRAGSSAQGDFRAARLSSSTSTYTELPQSSGPAADAASYAISGYTFGPLGYYHYVTSGTFPGKVLLSSPEHGLVAGQRDYGTGTVLFVNLPLGYFKALGTDAAPMHGFLSYFARDQVGVATLSQQPKGKGGLIYNWHVDDKDDLNDDVRVLLAQTRIFHRGPYSIHFTAGPDVNSFGDNLGMNLPGNATSQDYFRRLGNLGAYGSFLNVNKLPDHELGAHGGWIHNYWAANANDNNAASYTQYLQLNYDAVRNLAGQAVREYSAPGGNTPTWTVKWLEDRGVVAMYLVGDVGSQMVRSWRGGTRVANKLWSSPVMPFGKYATWEEFDDNGIPDAQSGQWLLDLQSFVVNHRTNRLFYNHPPGARAHLNPINALLTRADALQSQGAFNWYTMSQLADFSQQRTETTWSTSNAWGFTSFTANNARGLTDQTWLLPKASYTYPIVSWGLGTVTSDSRYWIVTAINGTTLSFLTQQLQ